MYCGGITVIMVSVFVDFMGMYKAVAQEEKVEKISGVRKGCSHLITLILMLFQVF